MKLVDIWNAREAFGRMTQLKMPPKLAYRLMKYGRLFMKEYGICEQRKNEIVYEAAGVPPGSPDVVLQPETPQHAAFVVAFTAFLQEESDLPLVGATMDELVDGLGSKPENVMSESDLELLEPFFLKPPADLKLVESAPAADVAQLPQKA